jgi:hypothetical protein
MNKGQGRLLRKDADDADEAEVAEVAERKRGNDNLVQKTCRNLFIQRQRRLKGWLKFIQTCPTSTQAYNPGKLPPIFEAFAAV